jgi:putative ABC transport system permease protein
VSPETNMPDWAQHVRPRLSSLGLSPTRENEIVEELSQHLEDRWQELTAGGKSPDEATRLALADFRDGDVLARYIAPLRQAHPPPSITPGAPTGHLLSDLWQDLRYAARMLRKQPGFAAAAILTLALGIGANTAIFSVANAVLLRPLPFHESERLVLIHQSSPKVAFRFVPFLNFRDWQDQNQVFAQMAASRGQNFNLTGGGEAERIVGTEVTHEYFAVFGAQPLLGRSFAPDEDKPGAPLVVVLGHGLWQRRFGGDPNILGQTLTLNNDGYTVIGVMPAGQTPASELWTSLGRRADDPRLSNRGIAPGLIVHARRKPGVTLRQAQAEMDALASRLERQYAANQDVSIRVADLTEINVRETRPALLVLVGAVAFVLLIACVNLANLLLTRALARQREIVVRIALGAARGRIIRQTLTESVMLSFCAGLVGLLLGYSGMDALVALAPANTPRITEVRMDGWVLAFTASLTLLTGLLTGLAPAWQATRANLNETLKEGGRGATGSRSFLRGTLVVVQVAFALVLLIGAGLMLKTFVRLQNADLGFNPAQVLSLRFALPQLGYAEPQKRLTFVAELLNRLKALPGVEAVAVTSVLPLSGSSTTAVFTTEAIPTPAPGTASANDLAWVTGDYFQALGIRFLRGRPFNDHDAVNSPPVVVVDETLARDAWPGRDPLGRQIRINMGDWNGPWRTVVGVVQHVKNYGAAQPSRFEAYLPHSQDPVSGGAIVLRTTATPASLAPAVRAQIRALDENLPVYSVQTMEDYVANQLGQRRLALILLGAFAVMAIALAAVGIYGVLSFAVSRRTHETGIRRALGAQTRDVLRLIIGQGMKLATLGIAVGLVGAFALTRVMKTLLFEVSATDPFTFAGIALLLTIVALLACWIPARRATKVDPLVALRYE